MAGHGGQRTAGTAGFWAGTRRGAGDVEGAAKGLAVRSGSGSGQRAALVVRKAESARGKASASFDQLQAYPYSVVLSPYAHASTLKLYSVTRAPRLDTQTPALAGEEDARRRGRAPGAGLRGAGPRGGSKEPRKLDEPDQEPEPEPESDHSSLTLSFLLLLLLLLSLPLASEAGHCRALKGTRSGTPPCRL